MPSKLTPVRTPALNPHFKHVSRAPYELGYLLRKLPSDFGGSEADPDTLAVAEAAAWHARNGNEILMHGLEAIGEVLFVAASNQNQEADPSNIAAIGSLIQHIAVEAQFLQETEWRMKEVLRENGWAE